MHRDRRRWEGRGCGRLAAVLLLALGTGCGPRPLDRVPEELLGRWRTDAPRYADRWLEVRPDELVWGAAGVALDRHPITRIERIARETRTEYRLHYREEREGYDDVLRVRLDPDPPLRARLGERGERWHREEAR